MTNPAMEPKYYFISYHDCDNRRTTGPGPKDWSPNWTVTDQHPADLFARWEMENGIYLKVPTAFREISKEDYDRLMTMRPGRNAQAEEHYWRSPTSTPHNDRRVLVLVRNKEDREVMVTGGHYHGNAEGHGWYVDTWRDGDMGHEVLGWMDMPENLLREGAVQR